MRVRQRAPSEVEVNTEAKRGPGLAGRASGAALRGARATTHAVRRRRSTRAHGAAIRVRRITPSRFPRPNRKIPHMRNPVLPATVTLLAALALAPAARAIPVGAPLPKGDLADFSQTKARSLADYKGRLILMEAFAYW